MDFNRLCKDILGLESKIRFAGVCDDSGEIKYGGQREGITKLLSPDETKRSNLPALARWALRDSLSPKVGKGRYVMAEYEKIKRITFPLEGDHLLLVTTEVDADHNKIIKETERSKSHNITNYKSAFLLCGSCYWCASLLDAELQFGSCPICHTVLTTQILDEELP